MKSSATSSPTSASGSSSRNYALTENLFHDNSDDCLFLESDKNKLDELEIVISEYEDLLAKDLVLSEKESIDMIHQCYASYRAFIENKDSRRDALTPLMDHVIIYRPSFGFLQMTDISYSPQSTPERKVIVSDAIAPGFPELLPSRNRISPPRGMISGVTLTASALVFEKG